jgi:hypothetical protein
MDDGGAAMDDGGAVLDGGGDDGGVAMDDGGAAMDAGPPPLRQCMPVAGLCPGCVDKDGDHYGIGADCLGPDCNDNDPTVTTPTTVQDCGVCGRACTNPHGTTRCENANCVPSCDNNYGDCDGDPTNGCETFLPTSTANCGGCGLACINPHGTTSCVDSKCQPVCDPNFGDCDNNVRNGCETDTSKTVADCGGCNMPCTNQNGSTTCENGVCKPVCTPGFYDCNGNPRDGCEADLSQVMTCGGCTNDPDCPGGFYCKKDQSPFICYRKKPLGTPCTVGPAGLEGHECQSNFCIDGVCCNNDCTGTCKSCALATSLGLCSLVPGGQDPRNDCPDDRASGVNACGRDGTCDGNGACRLYSSTTQCLPQSCSGGVQTNAKFCDGFGNCANAGPSTTLCVPFGCVGNSCAMSCGGGTNCAPNFTCVGTMCQSTVGTPCVPGGSPGCAPPGFCVDGFCCDSVCGGGCQKCNIEPGHCRPLPAGTTCTDATCNGNTLSKADLCDGDGGCLDSGTTVCAPYICDSAAPAHCKTSCTTNNDCIAGDTCCSGVCRNLLTDPNGCGSCGTVCRTNTGTLSNTCSGGTCHPTCAVGWGNCDNDPTNGCERNERTLTDCGGCNVPCSLPNASATCATGQCKIASCNAGFSNCDGSDATGCEENHTAYSNACGGAEFVGSYCGDAQSACGFLNASCCDAPWHGFASRNGVNSAWFSAQALECSQAIFCDGTIWARITLNVPAGVDYDLYVYNDCNTLIASSTAGTGQTDQVTLSWPDVTTGCGDNHTYIVEVRYYGGDACGQWTLTFEGRDTGGSSC